MTTMYRRAMLLATLALAACSTSPVPDGVSAADLEKSSFAIVSVSHDLSGDSAADTMFYIDYAGPASGRQILNSRRTNAFGFAEPNELKRRYGTLYIVQLKPGHHTVDGWQVYSAGRRMSSDTTLPRFKFETRPGQVVYLGNLHALLKMGSPLPGARAAYAAAATVQDMQSEDIALAESKMPALKGRAIVTLLPLGPWVGPHGDASATHTATDRLPIPVLKE